MKQSYVLPSEWYPQSGVQLTWPHKNTDWQPILSQILTTYICIAREIASREKLLIVAPDPAEVKLLLDKELPAESLKNITYVSCPTNDTWARDHGFITLTDNEGQFELLDFNFNGWGNKFEADLDNSINQRIYNKNIFNGEYVNHLDFVLEGGSIESDGKGTIYTTSGCLMAPHRNQPLSKADIELRLKAYLKAERVVWIDHGNLIGDDTDGHIDTLVRIAPDDTLIYVGCNDKKDPQYTELKLMEQQLQSLRTINNESYKLIRLPMPDPVIYNDERLPATYANFLIINGAVLVPTYNQTHKDIEACNLIQSAFPQHKIIGIDCSTITIQHGSLHCCTMQFPKNVLR